MTTTSGLERKKELHTLCSAQSLCSKSYQQSKTWLVEADMREWAIYIIVALILVSFVTNEYIDAVTEHEFYADMRDFMDTGGRNTAIQGYALCLRIEHLEREHHQSSHPSTCSELYGKSD